jgi:transcriptional regulator with XRE-family HTH domain
MSAVQANGERIREHRTKRCWSQEDLAEAAQCSPRTVQKAEASKPIAMATLRAIAGALEVDHTLLLAAELLVISEDGVDGDMSELPVRHDQTGEGGGQVAVDEDTMIAEISINRDPRTFSELERKQFLALLDSVLGLGYGQRVVVKWRGGGMAAGSGEGEP